MCNLVQRDVKRQTKYIYLTKLKKKMLLKNYENNSKLFFNIMYVFLYRISLKFTSYNFVIPMGNLIHWTMTFVGFVNFMMQSPVWSCLMIHIWSGFTLLKGSIFFNYLVFQYKEDFMFFFKFSRKGVNSMVSLSNKKELNWLHVFI